MVAATPIIADRRRTLWTNHPDACGTSAGCGERCGVPGMVLSGGSLSTSGWVVSTVLNMLLTDAKRDDAPCGWHPGGRGGHWSESYMNGQLGSKIQHIPAMGRVEDLRARLLSSVTETVSRLVTRGVASSVDVDVNYTGSGRFSVGVKVQFVSGNPQNVGVTAARTDNGWVWNV